MFLLVFSSNAYEKFDFLSRTHICKRQLDAILSIILQRRVKSLETSYRKFDQIEKKPNKWNSEIVIPDYEESNPKSSKK